MKQKAKQQIFLVTLLILAIALCFSACGKVERSISVKNKPFKSVYEIGDTINLTGGVLLVTFEDESTKELAMAESGVAVQYDFSVAGQSRVTLTYRGNTVDFYVTVNKSEPEITGLRLITPPTTLNYGVGAEALDLTGGVVAVDYDDETFCTYGLTESAELFSYDYDFSAAGVTAVKITLNGYGLFTVFEVEVVDDTDDADWETLSYMIARAGHYGLSAYYIDCAFIYAYFSATEIVASILESGNPAHITKYYSEYAASMELLSLYFEAVDFYELTDGVGLPFTRALSKVVFYFEEAAAGKGDGESDRSRIELLKSTEYEQAIIEMMELFLTLDITHRDAILRNTLSYASNSFNFSGWYYFSLVPSWYAEVNGFSVAECEYVYYVMLANLYWSSWLNTQYFPHFEDFVFTVEELEYYRETVSDEALRKLDTVLGAQVLCIYNHIFSDIYALHFDIPAEFKEIVRLFKGPLQDAAYYTLIYGEISQYMVYLAELIDAVDLFKQDEYLKELVATRAVAIHSNTTVTLDEIYSMCMRDYTTILNYIGEYSSFFLSDIFPLIRKWANAGGMKSGGGIASQFERALYPEFDEELEAMLNALEAEFGQDYGLYYQIRFIDIIWALEQMLVDHYQYCLSEAEFELFILTYNAAYGFYRFMYEYDAYYLIIYSIYISDAIALCNSIDASAFEQCACMNDYLLLTMMYPFFGMDGIMGYDWNNLNSLVQAGYTAINDDDYFVLVYLYWELKKQREIILEDADWTYVYQSTYEASVDVILSYYDSAYVIASQIEPGTDAFALMYKLSELTYLYKYVWGDVLDMSCYAQIEELISVFFSLDHSVFGKLCIVGGYDGFKYYFALFTSLYYKDVYNFGEAAEVWFNFIIAYQSYYGLMFCELYSERHYREYFISYMQKAIELYDALENGDDADAFNRAYGSLFDWLKETYLEAYGANPSSCAALKAIIKKNCLIDIVIKLGGKKYE